MIISGFRDQYRYLSNFWPVQIRYEGELYESVEAAYQAAKTLSPIEREWIRRAETPGRAKRLGKKVTLRPDWDQIKLQIMEDLVQQKFSKHGLQELLVATGDAELVEENTHGDIYWGVCGGKGENHLGKILMKVRQGKIYGSYTVLQAPQDATGKEGDTGRVASGPAVEQKPADSL
jgi:hypothetical protein